MKKLAFLLLLLSGTGMAADISNPIKFMFVADAVEGFIDVIDLSEESVVHRIETRYRVDDLTVTPYAPILAYTNIERQVVVFYDLKQKKELKVVDLPFAPRHLVMDTTGAKIGLSDSREGGFALLSAYSQSELIVLEDFPPTGDVLFDPNDVDIYYSNPTTGSIGLLDTNLKKTVEMKLTETPDQKLSSPSRSLDSRYIYVANQTTGEVYSLNAYSKIIYKTFRVGASPARPYSTPEGAFLYMMDEESGRLVAIDQYQFEEFADVTLPHGADLVTVGRFDRMNLFLSTKSREFSLFDNARQSVIERGQFDAVPIDTAGSVDGRLAYVVFGSEPRIAIFDLEGQALRYVAATENGAGAFVIGLTNNVCH